MSEGADERFVRHQLAKAICDARYADHGRPLRKARRIAFQWSCIYLAMKKAANP